jgi:transcriptional regulator with XRE-family HTH domain
MRDTVVIGPGGRPPRPQPPAQPLLRTTLGYLLRRARREQNRTLADVARAARVSLPYLSELERGRKEASSEILAAVCGALRLELSDLLAEAGRSLAADRARRALIEERARRRRERAGERPARVGEPADGTAAVGGGIDRSRGFPGTAPVDAPVVVPLDAVRGRRVPGPEHGSGHAHARLAA